MTFSIENTTTTINNNDVKCQSNNWTFDLSIPNKPCMAKGKFVYECGKIVCGACKNSHDKYIKAGLQHYSGIHGGKNGFQDNKLWRIQESKLSKEFKLIRDGLSDNPPNTNLNILPFPGHVLNEDEKLQRDIILTGEANDLYKKYSKNERFKKATLNDLLPPLTIPSAINQTQPGVPEYEDQLIIQNHPIIQEPEPQTPTQKCKNSQDIPKHVISIVEQQGDTIKGQAKSVDLGCRIQQLRERCRIQQLGEVPPEGTEEEADSWLFNNCIF